MKTPRYGLVEIQFVESTVEQIGGWYVCTDPPFPGHSRLLWDYDSLECLNHGVHGPFDTEEQANEWAREWEEETFNA